MYGYLVEYNEKYFIYYEKPDEMCQTGNWLTSDRVIPETVGQYTGLIDKNGTKIFEGDILSYVDCDGYTEYLKIGFKDGYFCYIKKGNEHDNELHNLLMLDPVICGNIHDNPELLKK